MIFCDTSTAAKLYVPEPQSRAVRKLLESEPGVASVLGREELSAGEVNVAAKRTLTPDE